MRIHFVTPGFNPAGGIVKLFDYVNHAVDLGHEPVIVSPQAHHPELPIFQLERFRRLAPDGGVPFVRGDRYAIPPDDFAFFTWPPHHDQILQRLHPETPLHHVIHIVQNVRHANPRWEQLDRDLRRGHSIRVLARPMSRVFVAEEVLEACRRWVNPSSPAQVIVEGHAWDFFSKERQGGLPTPIKVGYTTWKSDVGPAVEDRLAGDDYEFRSIRGVAGWDELRELYHWSDVFLGTPNREEGFFLVGLEAMAAGALLVVSDAVGNRAYSRWGENCLLVDHDDIEGYVGALRRLREMGDDAVGAMRDAGYAVLPNHALARERAEFGGFLEEIG